MAQSPIDQGSELRIVRRYPVAAERVWRAWTDPQALSRWFGPGEPGDVTQAEMDVRPEGCYHIAFRTPDGEEHRVSGQYREVVPHHKLVFTWSWQSTPERVSLVSIALRSLGPAMTELELVHTQFFDTVARDNHQRGWSATLKKLDHYLAD